MKKIYMLSLAIFMASLSYAQNCLPVDKPDLYFLDENNDGIDGDTNNAVFVSSATGNDANSGKMWAPVKSITMAMVLANANSKDIYISAGVYNISAPLILYDGVSIYGYYSSSNWSRNKFNTVVINGPSNVLYAKGNTKNSIISGIEFSAADAIAPSESSICVWIDSCSGTITLLDNIIRAGKGANGVNGLNGNNGVNGGDGGNGTNGICDGNTFGTGGGAGSSFCSVGGKGGDGGVGSGNGKQGANSGSGLNGGAGGASGDPGQMGVGGSNGTSGVNGNGGNSNLSSLYFDANGVHAGNGNNGTDGTDGTGGSGGGGGGGQYCTFCDDGSGNGGGGGGGAGSKGFGGQAGKGGGNSIAVFVRDSRVQLENNKLYTKSGGSGGKGGNGGVGGAKGLGGSGATFCTSEVGAGGKGGDGGKGGNGGGASGGNGGSSIGIVSTPSGLVCTKNNVINLGTFGNGGSGGTVMMAFSGNAGLNGLAVSKYGNVKDSVLAIHSELCIQDAKINRLLNTSNQGLADVYLSYPSPAEVKVSYTFVDGTAVNGVDYNGTNGQLVFLPYSSHQTIPFSVTKENGDTNKRTFTVQLSAVIGDAEISRSTATVKILPEGVSSIEGVQARHIQLYPNPVSDVWSLYFNSPVNQVNIVVYTMEGKAVLDLQPELIDGVWSLEHVDISMLSAGVYNVKIMSEGVMIGHLRIVKI
ncbi:MAG: T9SS type A sorting domain-containing protein [Bacteroidetes bacterium]|nr:T9SS type A sorting domain-containing protein [Bacteroidota bacterium]